MAESKKEAQQIGLAQRNSGTLSKQKKPLSIGALEQALLKSYPAEDAESWDRTGLLVGDPSVIVSGVAVALDVTPEALEAAQQCGANVLITHHPVFLAPPTSFMPTTMQPANAGSLVYSAISKGIALVSYHTALDVSADAQQVLPKMLQLQMRSVVVPLASSKRKGYGQMCAVRVSDAPLTLGQLAARCTSVFGRPPRTWGAFSQTLKHVVTCTGSAGGVAEAALQQGADCVVCGEIKYHDALSLSQAGLAIIELGHDTSELPLAAVLAASVESVGVAKQAITVLDQGSNWSYPETTRV